MPMFARRTIISWLATSCITSFRSEAHAKPDAGLVELGRQFDGVASNIDLAIEGRQELDLSMLQRLEDLSNAIEAQPATTIEGLRVKARAAAWALLGDLEAQQDCALAQNMSKSILRDLIRAFDPACENPGAFARLIDSDAS